MDNEKEKVKNLEKETEEFKQAKEKYTACRKVQLKLIIDYLESIGFTVRPQKGGCGSKNYGAQRFSIAYNLNN